MKGSLNTFLNAMTFPDKTMYPVASRNAADFKNLMDVYLDAVFFPNMIKDKQVLMQEGWHYHLDSADDDLTYRGVVYNEMKGVFSSPDSQMERHVMDALFPDTTYGVESGGNPDDIPNLTQEALPLSTPNITTRRTAISSSTAIWISTRPWPSSTANT